jgi:23S rRNA-/tRNA-specific pseudouridylate synthase
VRVDPPEGGRPARSRWRVLERGEGTTRLELHLDTGRTHQLRAHLAHLGHPIVGDVDYGAPSDGTPADPRVGRAIALRAVVLRLPHPGDGTPLVIDVRHP